MSELSTSLRNQLGRVIIEARSIAEAGAKRALESLAVDHHEPHGSMSLEERDLRVRLRARGRQLGDVRDRQRGSQSVGRLTHEVAYEHWHRMLFARFLAENGLLIHPEHEVAMSVRDTEELALETGQDPHQLAAGFAQNSLPQIFRVGDPVLEVTLAPETRQKLEVLLDSLSPQIFLADDSLGWTYQYWQAEKKDAVNASGEKIGADELPAVTQLFTEHYMVMFLYHNTLGAWHAGKVLADNPSVAESAETEDELRQAVALKTDAGDSAWEYLRFVRDYQDGDEDNRPSGPWRPAAGTFDGWPESVKELKVLDPCCGSGHFLVAGFKLLTRLRMLEEDLTLEDAISGVLQDNLFGLEIDPRCTQIAAFNLALAAWRWAGKPIDLPALNIACSGLSIGSSKKDWLALASNNEHLQAGLNDLYELFRQAPELGSLINPRSLGDDMFVAHFSELQPLLQKALTKESVDNENLERVVAAQGMAKAAELLADEYTLAITNVPYLGLGQQSKRLQTFCARNFPSAKRDLAVVIMARLMKQLSASGALAVVTPQSWLSQIGYKDFRESVLSQRSIKILARLGAGAFETIGGHVVNVALPIFTNTCPNSDSLLAGIDVSPGKSPLDKRCLLRGELINQVEAPIIQSPQLDNLKNPGLRMSITRYGEAKALADFASALHGQAAGDNTLFNRKFWEVSEFGSRWELYQCPPTETTPVSGKDSIVMWDEEDGVMAATANAVRHLNHKAQQWRSGKPNWGKQGIVVSLVGDIKASYYTGEIYAQSACVIVPNDPIHLSSLWEFARSGRLSQSLRELDPGLAVTVKTVLAVPFNPNVEIVDASHPALDVSATVCCDPTQWLFHGHPAKAEPTTVLQVAVARLLGYGWPPEVDPKIRLSDEADEWVVRCGELRDFSDDDGIVCLAAIRAEVPAVDRLRRLLAAAFGAEWSAAKEKALIAAAVGGGSRSPATLDIWLRDRFFEEHCKLFHQRPFVWHIWDGNRDGFHCLVNAHKLAGPNGEGRRTLEAITYSYLGDWIQRQKDDQKTRVEGADARLAAAQNLQQQLVSILKGEPPYDIFVRWKPLHEQAVGWDPDINDGIRLNIRPFMNAELRKGGKKGAGVLRSKPNIKWKKDRGKETESLRPVEDFPWFWGCKGNGSMSDRTDHTSVRASKAKFDGNRWNDLHYSRAVKEAARAAAKDSDK